MPFTTTREVFVERDGEIKLGDLPVRVGDQVKVLVIPERSSVISSNKYPLRGIAIRYDRPFDPDEWEANR